MLPYLSTRVHHLIHDVGEQKFRVVKLKISVINTMHGTTVINPRKSCPTKFYTTKHDRLGDSQV